MRTVNFAGIIKKLYSYTLFSAASFNYSSDISESLNHQYMEFVWYRYPAEALKDIDIDKEDTQLEIPSYFENNLLQTYTETKRFTKYFFGDPYDDCSIREVFCQHLLQLEPTIVKRSSFKKGNDLLIEKFVFSIEKLFYQTNIAIQNFLSSNEITSAMELIYHAIW